MSANRTEIGIIRFAVTRYKDNENWNIFRHRQEQESERFNLQFNVSYQLKRVKLVFNESLGL